MMVADPCAQGKIADEHNREKKGGSSVPWVGG